MTQRRDVIVIGPTRRTAHDFAQRLEPGTRARIVTANRDNIDGAQADHWIILDGVPADMIDLARYTAAKNDAPVTLR